MKLIGRSTEKKYRIDFLFRPGLTLSAAECRKLVEEVRHVAATCFDPVPDYQLMRGTPEELNDKAVAVARRADGTLAGFCSCVLLPVEGVGDVLHLGLTCVHPDDRSAGLTHKLTRKVVVSYMVRHKPLGRKLWVSNCAAVLSSLGNVAQHFEAVYPAPMEDSRPWPEHFRIADAIDRLYRDKIFILDGATFDPETFVFRGSVRNTVFQKDRDDVQFHHRKPLLNDFYRDRMNFQDGDEVLQIGYTSALSPLKHTLKRLRKPREQRAAAPAQA
ncbi:MAG: hypothetical protein FJ098_07570 [Deltaproteobacteria bacterium]|nr:hypothetical protein [Deltaproteobacteria bacterium]